MNKDIIIQKLICLKFHLQWVFRIL